MNKLLQEMNNQMCPLRSVFLFELLFEEAGQHRSVLFRQSSRLSAKVVVKRLLCCNGDNR